MKILDWWREEEREGGGVKSEWETEGIHTYTNSHTQTYIYMYVHMLCMLYETTKLCVPLTDPVSAFSSAMSTSLLSASFSSAAACCSMMECCLESCLIRSVRDVPRFSSGLLNDVSRDFEC